MGDAPVYLDHNATTPLAPEVMEAISSSLHLWGNPSSPYQGAFFMVSQPTKVTKYILIFELVQMYGTAQG